MLGQPFFDSRHQRRAANVANLRAVGDELDLFCAFDHAHGHAGHADIDKLDVGQGVFEHR